MKTNLVLLGYRGTGKSTVGAGLAARMKWPVVSLDAAIVERAGMPIPEIVERHGWARFRELEREEVMRTARLEHHILDCGGGVVEDARNVADLRASGFSVLLTATVATIARRIGGDANRPSLTGKSIVDEIEEKLAQRAALYAAAADVTVATDNARPGAIVTAVLDSLPAGFWSASDDSEGPSSR